LVFGWHKINILECSLLYIQTQRDRIVAATGAGYGLMPTDYTQEQLEALEKLLHEKVPRFPTGEDARTAPVPPSVATAGAPGAGILVNFGTHAKGNELIVFLNPVVARQLFIAINMAAEQSGWWDRQLKLLPKAKG
jgi:hypothetical protein